ncbi:MAG: restriction endonuclease subunit S [Methylotenera sp.]
MSTIQQLITEHMDIWTAADTGKRSGRGRASSNAGSVYGVKKLRELILELAVCGRLVPQDANDEPASELLKRIKAEKAKLVAEGKIKKEKPLAPITDDEKLFELPHGWVLVRNCELFQLRKGRIPKSLNEDELGLPYLDIDALDRNIIRRYSEELTCPQSTDKDILVVCDGSRSGLVLDGKNGIIGSTLSIIDTPVFIQNYIKLIFKQGFEIFNTSMKGAAIPHLDTQKLLQNPTALPPLAEQHRIVAKVDELMALCDQLEAQYSNAAEAHEKLVSHLLGTLTQSQSADDFSANWQRITAHFDMLFTTEASLDALKQTLLQLAVMGKLVPQDPKDEPASELLKRIQAEKAKLVADGKIKKDKPLAPIGEDEKPFELPENWEWVRLGHSLLKITDGTHHSPPNLDNGAFKYISAKNIKSWGLDLSDITYITKDMHEEIYSRCNPELGDVLYIKDGATTGIATINTLEEPFSMLSSVALLKPSVGTNNQFLLKAMTAPFFYAEMRSEMTGVAITRVTLAKLNNAVIPLPPLAEQHRIVAKVDELMALCDQLKTGITAANQQQQAIADSLVAQAVTA